MIVPIVAEETWRKSLCEIPAWNPPVNSILLVAPHPDDETLAAGGFIAAQRLRGVDIVVAAVTDGENAYTNTPGLGTLRQQEQQDALNRLGVRSDQILRFHLPDSNVSSREAELVELLLPHASNDTHILAPWIGDFHPDHIACGLAAEEVERRTGAFLTSYFFWTWHRGDADVLAGLNLVRFDLTPALVTAKLEALQCHRSQLTHESGAPILPDSLLDPAKRPFEVFLLP